MLCWTLCGFTLVRSVSVTSLLHIPAVQLLSLLAEDAQNCRGQFVELWTHTDDQRGKMAATVQRTQGRAEENRLGDKMRHGGQISVFIYAGQKERLGVGGGGE